MLVVTERIFPRWRGNKREQPQIVKREYESAVITPDEFMGDMQILLPRATTVEIMTMYSARGEDQPLPQLSGLLKDVVRRGGIARISVSKNHVGLTEDPTEDANTQEIYQDLSENGVDVYFTRSQGRLGRVNIKGWTGNVHSKFVQVRTNEKVYTYLPEFNMTARNMAHVNHAIRFEETLEDAVREGSISQTVAEYMRKVRMGDRFADYSQDVDSQLRLVVDAGRFDTSEIRKTAWKEVLEPAKHDIILLNQYPPYGSLLHGLIRKARDGVHSYVLLSGDCLEGKYQQANSIFRGRIEWYEDKIHVFYAPKTEENPHGVVHSKWLLADTGAELGPSGELFFSEEHGDLEGVAQATSSNQFPLGYAFSTGEAGFLIKGKVLVKEMAKRAVAQFTNTTRVSCGHHSTGQTNP